MTQTLTTKVKPIKFNQPAAQAQISWRDRAYELSYWTEAGLEKESLLQEAIDFLLLCKYFVAIDRGWSNWDLEVYQGIWSRAEIKVCTENHGGNKRLLRVRCGLRLSQFAIRAMLGYSLFVVVGMIVGMPELAAIATVASALNAAIVLYQNWRLGQTLCSLLEKVAQKLDLQPLHASGTKLVVPSVRLQS